MATQKSVIDEDALNIYTDGSSFSGPRAGGIGIRYVTVDEFGDEVSEDLELPGYAGATNNQMELLACTIALRVAIKDKRACRYPHVIIYTDSQYVRDNYPRAMFEWARARWKNKHGRPIENADLWKDLIREVKNLNVRFDIRWVKGHSKNTHNKAVDKIARRSAKNPLSSPLRPVGVRRKTSDRSVERGCVEMLGQEMAIRVVTAERMRPQRVNKYRYQVLSADSIYFDMIDFAYSEEYLREGHHYTVRVNEDQKHPQIVEVIEELERE